MRRRCCCAGGIVLVVVGLVSACGSRSQVEPSQEPDLPTAGSADAGQGLAEPVVTDVTEEVTGAGVVHSTRVNTTSSSVPAVGDGTVSLNATAVTTTTTTTTTTSTTTTVPLPDVKGEDAAGAFTVMRTGSAAVLASAGIGQVEPLLSVVRQRWKSRPVATVEVFMADSERVALDACVAEAGTGGGYRHVQHVVDHRLTGWQIDATFDIGFFENLDSCVSSFS